VHVPRALAPTLAVMGLLLGANMARAAEPAAGGLARVQAAGVLRWGGDVQGGEPYVFEDPEHPEKLVGFEVEIAEALAAALGVRAVFVQNDWTLLVPTLERARSTSSSTDWR
jgi:polar amino acid transport system substrate-binding protein